MSDDDLIEVPRTLLQRLKDEVARLRARVAELEAEQGADVLEALDAVQAERDRLVDERDEARAEAAQLPEVRAARDAIARDLDDARAEAAGQAEALEQRAAQAEAVARELRAERDRLLWTHPAPPPDLARTASVSPGASHSERTARAYVAWCRRGSGLVSRPFLFEAFLRESVSAEATVMPVFRDPDAPTFRARPARGAEHWLVTVGEDRALVPQPQSDTGFRELAPVFDGQATPHALGHLAVAQVEATADGFRLVSPGRVTQTP